MLVDCHTHLDQYDDGELSGIVARAREAGVGVILVAGTTVDSSARCIALARHGPRPPRRRRRTPHRRPESPGQTRCPASTIWPAPAPASWRSAKSAWTSASGPRIWPSSTGPSESRCAWPGDLRLPVIFHSRGLPNVPETHREVLRVLREERGWEVGGAMHYFQGDATVAAECLDLGFHVSLAKPLLRLPHLQEVAAALPLDGIVLETDAYPQPFKGNRERWTEPKDVRQVAEKLAELKGTTLQEVAGATCDNLLRLYRRLAGTAAAVMEEALRRDSSTEATLQPAPGPPR